MSPNRWEQPAVYLQSGDPETENTPTLHAPGLLGVRFTVDQPRSGPAGAEANRSKRYQLIRTDSTMTVAPYRGATAWWSDKTQYMVTTNSPTGRNAVAGVFQYAITPGNYGCVQIEGPATTKFVDASMAALAANDQVQPSATNSKCERVAAGTALTYVGMGTVAGGINLGDATAIVNLQIPETT